MQRAIRRPFEVRRRFFIGLTAAALLWPAIAGPAVARSTPPIDAGRPAAEAAASAAASDASLEAMSLDATSDPGAASSDPADPMADPTADRKAKGPVSFRAPTVAELHAAGLHTSSFQCPDAFVSTPGDALGPGLAGALGGTSCTHGGDYVGDTAPEFAPALFPGYSSPGIPCYSTGPFVHVFYGYRSTDPNRIATVGPRIRETVSRIDDIFANAAAKVGAVRHVRWRMAACKLVITAVALPANTVNQQNPGPIRANLISRGIMSSAEKGLIFTDDGESGCSGIAGIAEWQDDESTSSSNLSNRGGMMARVFGWCWSPVGYIDVSSEVGAHELSHTLGAVGDTAPHSSARTGGRSHCTDGIDLMCYNDGGGEPHLVCADAYPPTLDCNKDDYFNPNPPAGSYLATHWNPARNVFLATTAPGSFEVPPRPKATLTSPGTSVVAGTINPTATATAASDGSAVVQVEFWLGQTSIGTDSSAPFTAQFDTIPDSFGGFPNGAVLKLVAVAVDAQGRTGPSTAANLTVGNPKVRLTAPAAWARQPSSSVTWSAIASAWPGRTVTKVELLDSGTVIATDTTAPYGGAVPLDDGAHFLQARVTDSGGVSRESVERDVSRGPTGPVVTIVSPAEFESVAATTGKPQNIEAIVVARPGRTVTKVDFTANLVPIGGGSDTTSPYEVSWTPLAFGSYEIVATATDSTGATGTSNPRTVDVSDVPGLSVSITSPGDNAGASGSVNATAAVTKTSNWVVQQVDFELDGSNVGTDLTAPYQAPIDLTGYVGRHVLRAVVSADDSGSPGTAASAGTILAMPGGVTVGAPANGATLTGNVTVTAGVTGFDPNAISPLYVAIGDDLLVTDLFGPAFTGSFSSAGLEDGPTTLAITDGGFGSSAINSAPIGVTLKNATASWLAPASGATIAANTILSAKATADGGNLVEQVRFFVDGVDIGGDWSSPFQLTWNIASVANGAHTIRADAILTDGRTLSTGSRSVTVKVGAVTRLAGTDRYGTAVAISKASFAPGVPVAYIATGASFPDALAGAAVAGHVGGPILLVPGTSIPAAVAAELTRLKPAKIVVLGGTSVVSDGVKAALAAYVGP